MPNTNSNLTIKEIKLAQWLQGHKFLFKRLLTIGLITTNLVIWVIAIYHLSLFLIYRKAYQETILGLTKNLINFQVDHERLRPVPLIISNETLLFIGRSSIEPSKTLYDLVAEIENPNDVWMINSLEAEFTLDGQKAPATLFLLPNEKKYLYSLNQAVEGRVQTISLEIQKFNWQRIRPEKRTQLDILKNLVFEEINFIPPMIVNQKITPAQIKFKANNKSAYSFWQVNAQIALYQGSKIVDFYVMPIKNWLANQSQQLEINLVKPVEFVSQIKIIPDINLLDENVFIKP